MENKPVAVMGMGPSGLFLVRQLQNITKNIYAIGRTDDVGMYSRYIIKGKRYYAQSEESVYEALRSICLNEHCKPVVYLCSDQYLTLLLDSSRRWERVADLSKVDLETLRKINNKEIINRYCLENGIKSPATMEFDWFLNKEDKIFPVIIKWKEKSLETKKNPVGKVKICENAEQFNRIASEIKACEMGTEQLLVQEFVPGNNDFQYSVGGYYEAGKPIASVTVKQIKQFPQGVSAQVYTINDDIAEKIKPIAYSVADMFCFSGFMEIEFKINEKSGDAYLLDVNPRPWGWVSILGAAYKGFYTVLKGEKIGNIPQMAVWTSPIRKFLSLTNDKNTKFHKKSYRYVKAWDIRDIKDLFPSFLIYVMAVKKKLKRNL